MISMVARGLRRVNRGADSPPDCADKAEPTMKFVSFVSARARAQAAAALATFAVASAVTALVAFAPAPACAIATFGGSGRNSFEPSTNPLTAQYANRGWQYMGMWGDTVGTAISPNYFVTAAHLGGAPYGVGATFTFDGVPYVTTASSLIPGSDLRLFKVDGTLPRYAQLYTGNDEVTGGPGGLGKEIFTVGRGPGRGAANGSHGWYGGGVAPEDLGTMCWGTNNITDIVFPDGGGPGSEYLYYTFDQGQGDHESGVLSGDSGSAIFLEENGIWKLGGTIFGVDGFFSNIPNPTPNDQFLGSFYDTRGLYAQQSDGSFALVTGDSPVPSGSYAARVSVNVAAIDAITGQNSFAAVPEPSPLALLAPLGAALVYRRRRVSRAG